MSYELSYREKHNLNESDLTDAQRTLHYIAENMRMQKSISEDGYKHFQQAIEALGQEEKTAYWLPYAERDGKTVEWVCSSCRRINSATSNRTEYCPICGAKMEVSE